MCVACAAAVPGFATMSSRKALSHGGSTRPARGPCNWCDMPPGDLHVQVLHRATDGFAEHQQRLPVGGGYVTTLTASGITRHGHCGTLPKIIDICTVRP